MGGNPTTRLLFQLQVPIYQDAAVLEEKLGERLYQEIQQIQCQDKAATGEQVNIGEKMRAIVQSVRPCLTHSLLILIPHKSYKPYNFRV